MIADKPVYKRLELQAGWAEFSPTLEEIAENIRNRRYIAICGTNNSGKSTILKGLSEAYGKNKSRFIGSSRFLMDINFGADRSVIFRENYEPKQSYLHEDINRDGLTFAIEKHIFSYSNKQRDRLLKACSIILNAFFELKNNPDNQLSVPFLLVDGVQLKVSSSGTRLLLRLLAEIMSDEIEVAMIDEPELGYAPEVQRRLFKFLHDHDLRKEYFPNLKSIVVATHSHLFLDKSRIDNNLYVTKNVRKISCSNISNIQELNQLQINLLGNELDTYLLPSAIIVVEGKTDVEYIKRVVAVKHPDRNIIVVGSEGNPEQKVRSFSHMLGGAGTTPYYDRTFVILDSVLRGTTRERVYRNGIKEQNVIQWSENGIEYFYPTEIMKQLFMCSDEDLSKMKMTNSDEIEINGVTIRKAELASKICSRIDDKTLYPLEFQRSFLDPLSAVLS